MALNMDYKLYFCAWDALTGHISADVPASQILLCLQWAFVWSTLENKKILVKLLCFVLKMILFYFPMF